MKKWMIIGIILIAIVVIGYFIFIPEKNESEKKVIKIGVILPLTGDAAFVGEPMKNGFELRIKQFNERNAAYNIKLIFEDSKAEPKLAVFSINKLNSEKIRIVLGPASSSGVLAIAPIANNNKITILSPSASAPSITFSGEYIFRNELSDLKGASKQAELAYTYLKWKNISILAINNDYGVGVANSFQDSFRKLGGNVVNSLNFAPSQTDYKTILNKIKSDNSEAVFIVAQNEYVNIIKQMKELHINKLIYATPVFENQNNLSILGETAEGLIYTYYGEFDFLSSNQKQMKFIQTYESEYLVKPNYYASLAYESADLILTSLEMSEYDISKVNTNLYKIKDYNSITGKLSFDANGDIDKPVSLKTVKNGNFIFLTD